MPDWELEYQEYASKLNTQVKGITKILSMNTHGLIDNELQNRLLDLKSKAQILQTKLKNNEFEIAIVGLEKAGKSTFANALMGNDILPSKDARCTYTSTNIRYGDDTASVEFFTWQEFDRSFKEKLKLLAIPQAHTLSFETLSLSEYQELFRQVDTNTQTLYGGTLNKDIEDILRYKKNLERYLGAPKLELSGSEMLESTDFKRFIEDPSYAIAVKEIILHSSRLSEMKNAVIYDVPGFDSPTQMHKDQTIEKMKLADAIVLIASACKPSFTGPLIDIFRKEADYDGVKFGDKMFVFANMADMATTLRDNMDIICNDLEKHRIMKPENMRRIIPGSARARLEAEKKVDGNMAMAGLEARGLSDDGIGSMKTMLEAYNKNERFEILKTRINKMQNDIMESFRQLMEQKNQADGRNAMYMSSEISIKTLQCSAKEIREKLEAYRAQLRNSFNSPVKPLTTKMTETVINNINSDNFGVTDDELTKAVNKAGITTDMEIPVEIDNTLRKQKSGIIYNSFLRGVVNLALEEHSNCDESITRIFLDGLHVSELNAYYNELKNNIIQYLNIERGSQDHEGYYKSLVDRFSIDLFEILLTLPYGDMSRWNKFMLEATNFYSLAMFDNGCDLTITPDQQPLHYLLLFHDHSQEHMPDYLKEAMEFLETVIGIVLDEKIARLLKRLVKLKGNEAVKCLKDILNKLDTSKPAETKLEIVSDSLEAKVSRYIREDTPDTGMKLNMEAYEHFFDGKRNKTSETVRAEIDEDIDILQSTLQNVVINAIRIEKPFLALEFQTIDNIIRSLDEEKYGAFIANNIPFIAAEQFRDLEIQEQKRLAQAGIISEIESILDEIRESKSKEPEPAL